MRRARTPAPSGHATPRGLQQFSCCGKRLYMGNFTHLSVVNNKNAHHHDHQFTQDQMRTVTGVSIETVRHWRKIVPYLATKAGKAARFSFADLLGLAVTNELVGSLGVHIGSVSAGVDKLFELLTAANAPALEGAIAYITSTSASLQESSSWNTTTRALKQPALVIPLDPLIAQLQQHMLPMMPAPTQTALPFPPEAVRSRT